MIKKIPGFDSYEIDEEGNVYKSGKPKTVLVEKNGKPYVTLWDTTKEYQIKKYISSLVALTFLGEPETENNFVCYRDGDVTNAVLDNLYYGTRSEMQKACFKHRLESSDSRDLRVCKMLDLTKSVFKLDPKTLAIVESFETVKHAAKYMDVPYQAIVASCYDKNKTCCHYRWCFDYQYSDVD